MLQVATEVYAHVKQQAHKELFKPAGHIPDTALLAEVGEQCCPAGVGNLWYLKHTANRVQQNLRPPPPNQPRL